MESVRLYTKKTFSSTMNYDKITMWSILKNIVYLYLEIHTDNKVVEILKNDFLEF